MMDARIEPKSGPDLRYCGVCWAGKNGVRMHYCDLELGHKEKVHRCHCGETLPGPTKLAGSRP